MWSLVSHRQAVVVVVLRRRKRDGRVTAAFAGERVCVVGAADENLGESEDLLVQSSGGRGGIPRGARGDPGTPRSALHLDLDRPGPFAEHLLDAFPQLALVAVLFAPQTHSRRD